MLQHSVNAINFASVTYTGNAAALHTHATLCCCYDGDGCSHKYQATAHAVLLLVPAGPDQISAILQVQVDKDRKLVISGERKKEEMSVDWRQQKQERRFGAFQRKFQLPDDADIDKIKGKAEDGVLAITIRRIPKEDVPSDSTSIPIY